MAERWQAWTVGAVSSQKARSLPLSIGLWLLMSQVALAEPLQPRLIMDTLEAETGDISLTSDLLATISERWAQIAQAELVEITDVQLEATADGFTLRFETSGALATPETSITGNAAIADIPNAVLNLSDDDEFSASDPADGIALINVSSLPDNRVRIAITGTETAPVVTISLGATGFDLSATPGDPTAQVSADNSIQIVVTGEQDRYFVPNTSTATRTDTPILEVPASIQVIPREILEAQQVVDLGDALRNVGGASVSSFEGRGFQINLRGFEGAPLFRDGFRLYSPNDNGDAAGQGFPEIAIIEQVEVLRGPASILFGQIEPGGAVNVVSKRPLEVPFYEAELEVGSFDFVQPRIDFSGPLTDDNSLLYRLNAVYQYEDGFRGYDANVERFFFSPALTWRISDRTNLNLQLEYLDDTRPYDTGLVAVGDGVADLPRDRVLGEPDDFIESEFLSVGYDLEHEISDQWTLRNAFRYLDDYDDLSTALSFPFIGGLDEATGTLNRVFGEQIISNETLSLQTNVVGEFATGPLEHTLLAGVDLARYRFESESFTDFSLLTPINVFDPVYGTVPRPDRPDAPTSSEEIDTDSLQVYLQDQIQLLDNLILVAGVNYETVSQETVTSRGGVTTEEELDEDEFTPRFGLVYQPLDNLSLYASYSRSFLPSAAVTVEGEPLEPETGEGFEVGIKAELFDGNLLATLAYFNLTKQNVATADPDDPRFSVATGEQDSQGIELDIVGEILPGWDIIASYSYIDAEIAEDNRFDVGNRLAGVAEHSASLWTTYEIAAGDLDGLGFGLGFNWVGDRQGDLANSFELDSYFLTNAAVFYERQDWRLAVNFQNIFNVDYIVGTPRTRTRGIEPGDPFTVIGSIRYQF
ncbi:MAG: TonB-dependent siderophore receptor [Cyanothece sp. SIO2G6]|nr:TonB-dependent siderophore receptor [Cyanothece sp. SIO2G6]